MTDVHILAIDLAKRSFQICAIQRREGRFYSTDRIADQARGASARTGAMHCGDGGLCHEPLLGRFAQAGA
jgi:hypothetical protein